MKDFIVSIRMFLFMTVLLGIAYPILVTLGGQALFPKQSSGGFVSRGGLIVGASLIGQKFESDRYFWSRPSAVDNNPLPSGGSNLGPTSADLKKSVDDRSQKLRAANPEGGDVIPQDLLFASASGLDPHISPEAAAYQVPRIVKSRHLPTEKVNQLVNAATSGRQFGFLGEPTVNVLALNLALDQYQGITEAPTPAPTPVATPLPNPAAAPVPAATPVQ